MSHSSKEGRKDVFAQECIALLMAAVALLAAGCTTSAPQQARPDLGPSQPFATTGLSGEWEVSDGSLEKTITIDCTGTGHYGWQDGRVITTTVAGNYWAGTWIQSGNDREGGFEVQLSDDRSKAEGRWWYSRIGGQHFTAGERGDTFTLMRPMNAKQTRDDCRRQSIHEALGPH